MNLHKTPLSVLNGIGKKREELFAKLGVTSVGALLEFYPRLYEDWSVCFGIKDAPIDTKCCIKATVSSNINTYRVRKGMTIYSFNVNDGVERMKVVIFNNKYLADKVKINTEILLFGKITLNKYGKKEMNTPQIETAKTPKMRPIYRQTEGLNSTTIENTIKQALKLVDDNFFDPFSDEVRNKCNLCHKRYAIEKVHFPNNQNEANVARYRLIFEELLYFSMAILKMKNRKTTTTKYYAKFDYTNDFLKKLPFELTNAQLKAVKDAVDDMKIATPMNRLLQGDVGSGKTAVAATIMYNCVKNGFQCALMAPTEVLASQHYSSFSKLMQNSGVRIMLLSGSTPKSKKEVIYDMLKNGEIDIIIGTHALIQSKVEFKNLALVVTDEQHRFGVGQRAELTEKGDSPHIYVMSATPIPRTLALMIYGDLDISVLNELPKGRQPIETFSVNTGYRKRVYNYVKKHLDEGRQGYIVCPMIDENDEIELASAVEFFNKLSTSEFADYKLGLLTGRMKPSEKNLVMSQFSSGEIQLLISTTVVEVGVDVPNAVIMVIENAERFGLSQLHQLRGRVGRGQHKSTCILISNAENEIAQKRFKVLVDTNDGFKIADEDLKLRGPGDFFGSRQHGLPEFKIANILNDMKIFKEAQNLAKDILKDDPELQKSENTAFSEKVSEIFSGNIINS